MNVNTLHKALGKLIADGHGRKPVLVDKRTYSHPLEEEGAVMLGVVKVDGPRWINRVDDDGGYAMNKDGTESGSYVVVLKGNHNGE